MNSRKKVKLLDDFMRHMRSDEHPDLAGNYAVLSRKYREIENETTSKWKNVIGILCFVILGLLALGVLAAAIMLQSRT